MSWLGLAGVAQTDAFRIGAAEVRLIDFEHRRIANEDVRNYLGCDVVTARNRLTDPRPGSRQVSGTRWSATAARTELAATDPVGPEGESGRPSDRFRPS
ncbi:MAG: hypothetical protein QOD83_1278 [Solirubrobacteraceae bacterium]|jgi:hypothetical protein|nr:hypothetical protein [Solirubrobacteraceae bacterium]